MSVKRKRWIGAGAAALVVGAMFATTLTNANADAAPVAPTDRGEGKHVVAVMKAKKIGASAEGEEPELSCTLWAWTPWKEGDTLYGQAQTTCTVPVPGINASLPFVTQYNGEESLASPPGGGVESNTNNAGPYMNSASCDGRTSPDYYWNTRAKSTITWPPGYGSSEVVDYGDWVFQDC